MSKLIKFIYFVPLLILLIIIQPALSVFKDNASTNTTVVDGELIVEDIRVGELVVDGGAGTLIATKFFGDGSGLTGINSSGGGWKKIGNLVQLDNLSDSVVINTFSPSSKLTVAGDAQIFDGALKLDPGSSINTVFGGGLNNSLVFNADALDLDVLGFLHFVSGGSRMIWTKGSNLGAGASSQEIMRLTNGGNLGVLTGVDSISNKLEVNGDLRATKIRSTNASGLTNIYPNVNTNLAFRCQDRFVNGYDPNSACQQIGMTCVQAAVSSANATDKRPLPCTNLGTAGLFVRCCTAEIQ